MKLLIHILKEKLLFLVVIKVVFSHPPLITASLKTDHWKYHLPQPGKNLHVKGESLGELFECITTKIPKICQLSPCIHLTKVKFCHIHKSRLCWVTNFWIKLSCHYSISWYKLDCFIRISRPEKSHKCIHVKLWDKIQPKTKMSPIKSDT